MLKLFSTAASLMLSSSDGISALVGSMARMVAICSSNSSNCSRTSGKKAASDTLLRYSFKRRASWRWAASSSARLSLTNHQLKPPTAMTKASPPHSAFNSAGHSPASFTSSPCQSTSCSCRHSLRQRSRPQIMALPPQRRLLLRQTVPRQTGTLGWYHHRHWLPQRIVAPLTLACWRFGAVDPIPAARCPPWQKS